MHKVVEDALSKGYELSILDGDKTITTGNSAKSVGLKLLENEMRKGNVNNVIKGFHGLLKIYMNTARNGGEENAGNLKLLCQALGNAKCADYDTVIELAEKHRREKEIDGVRNFIEELKTGGRPVYLSTQGCSFSADVLMDAYDLDGRICNPAVCDYYGKRIEDSPYRLKSQKAFRPPKGSRIIDCKTVMKNVRDKCVVTAEFLESQNLFLEKALSVGDNHKIDSALLEASLQGAASPFSDKKIRKQSGVIEIKSYVS
jgi:hypothetical protein